MTVLSLRSFRTYCARSFWCEARRHVTPRHHVGLEALEARALLSRLGPSALDVPDPPPPPLAGDVLNRISLLDVHDNNYLFRGPEPLAGKAQDYKIDYKTLIETMNKRLKQERAPLEKLPQTFNFIDVALIFNNRLGDTRTTDGFSLAQEYSTVLGAPTPTPPAYTKSSLFTLPLDTSLAPGVTQAVKADGTAYKFKTNIIWQPESGAAYLNQDVNQENYKAFLQNTTPGLDIATIPGGPQRLTNPLPNLTSAVSLLENYMAQPSVGTTNIIYLHCMQGHDRTGMVSTAYVLGTYGASFTDRYSLKTAYKFGMNAPDLSGTSKKNYWWQVPDNRGALKKEYMSPDRALAYFYDPADGIQTSPKLDEDVPSVPLWDAGYTFSDTAPVLPSPSPGHESHCPSREPLTPLARAA